MGLSMHPAVVCLVERAAAQCAPAPALSPAPLGVPCASSSHALWYRREEVEQYHRLTAAMEALDELLQQEVRPLPVLGSRKDSKSDKKGRQPKSLASRSPAP